MATNKEADAPITRGEMEQILGREMGTAIGDAVSDGIARQTRRKVTFGEYDPRSPFQPDKKLTLKLKRPCYQNGRFIDKAMSFNSEIDLLNRITHSGRYIERLVEVVVNQEGADETVYISWNNRTPDQRMEMKGHAKNWEDMLRQIVVAQEEEDLEAAEAAEAKKARRPFGNSKASQEARAKAEG